MAALIAGHARRLVILTAPFVRTSQITCLVANYSKKVAAVAPGPAASGPTFQVELDPEKVVNNCCGANIYVEGEEIELKPHSEYPDWLWELRTEKGAPDLSEIEYGSDQYWRRYRQLSLREKNVLTKLKRKKKIIKIR